MTKRLRAYTNSWPRPLPAEVTRSSLLERVTRASDASLFVLAAPSGYGKTTLLGQLARTSQHTIWLTLSERHTDLTTLANELMTSVTQVAKEATFARIRKAVADGAQVSALAVPIARELDDLEVNLRILIDQANLLGEDAIGWLETFALALGEGHQVAYCAYDLASERLAVPLASGRALLLTATDLAFSEEESRAYLKARGSLQDAAEVQRALEGWPAGVGLAAAEVGHIVSPDNLLGVVFARLPQAAREALPEASVLEVWREADAEKLGCKLPKGWLREAQRSGLPLTPLSARTYRPHTLVLEMLERELQNCPERYAKLHTFAGNEARKNGDLISALQHYQKARQLAEASQVAKELIPQLNDRQEYKLICDLLGPLSPSENDLPPEVAAYHGYALLQTGQVKHSEKLLKNLKVSNQGEPLTSIFLAELCYEKGQYFRMYKVVNDAFEWIGGDHQLHLARTTLVDALSRLERYEEALLLARELVASAEASGDQLRVASALLPLKNLYFHMNDYTACEQTIKRAIRSYAELGMSDSETFINLSSNLNTIYNIRGRFAESFDIISKILPASAGRHSLKRPILLSQLANTMCALSKYKDSVAYYQEALALFLEYGSFNYVKQIRYELSNSVCRSGDPILARELLDEAHREQDIGDYDSSGDREFYEGLYAFDNGNMPKAKQDFTFALVHLNNDIDAISSHAYILEIDRREGLLTLEKVEEFVSRLDAFGQDSILHTDAEPKRPLYRECVARGWFAERFAPFTHPLPSNVIEPKRFVLEVQTLGSFHCDLEQTHIKLPFAKAAELLIWLTFHGPATREQIIDALWDGSSDPKHIEYGKLALRRLRTSLAEYLPFNPLVYTGHKYQLAAELEVKLDAQELLDAFETADLEARRNALGQYSSTFLPSTHSEWAEQMRTRLQDAAFSTAVGLGRLYEGSDVTSALWAYRKAVELDPLELDTHQALVQLLQRSGDEVGARLAYLTYTRVLKTEYGEAPALTFDELMRNTRINHLN